MEKQPSQKVLIFPYLDDMLGAVSFPCSAWNS